MLKEKRKELGYTQEQIAGLIGISLRQYARIDKEEDLPRRDVLKKIINIFKLSIAKQVKNNDQKKTRNVAKHFS